MNHHIVHWKTVKPLLLSIVAVAVFFLCVQREDEIGSRNNPFDAGGTRWDSTTPPEVTLSGGNLWVEFDHATGTGEMELTIAVTDSNFPNDTVSGELRISDRESVNLQFDDSLSDTTYAVTDLLPETALQCTVYVADLKNAADTSYLPLVAPSGLPPYPPTPSITAKTSAIMVAWDTVAGAGRYLLYAAVKKNGPYTEVAAVNQKATGIPRTLSVSDTPGDTLPVYYRLAAENSSGRAFCPDTLTGRTLNSSLATPVLEVTKGISSEYIGITVNAYGCTECRHVELYRRIGRSGTMMLIDTVPFDRSGSTFGLSVHDSVVTTDTCWYTAAVIDFRGRTSSFSTLQYGLIERLPAPANVALSSQSDYIHLDWSYVSGAASYRIYRIPGDGGEEKRIATVTNQREFNDTLFTSDTFCYSVAAVDKQEHEGMRSAASCGRIQLYPAPDNVQVSFEDYVDHVALSWSPVPKATGYVIERAEITVGTTIVTGIDAGTDTSYNDTLRTVPLYRYRVAATDSRGPGTFSEYKRGSIIMPSVPSYSVVDSVLRISWVKHSRALAYLLLRGTDTSDFTLIDSTTKTWHYDTVSTLGTLYYRLILHTSEGRSRTGTYSIATIQLNPPDTLVIDDEKNGAHLLWPKVAFAESYRIYRSDAPSGFALYHETTDTFHVDSLTENTRYYYQVASVHDTMESARSMTVRGGRLTPPPIPVVKMTPSAYYYIQISWTVSESGSRPDGFYIYRSVGSSTNMQLYDSTAEFLYRDSVPDTSRYFYRVSAFNDSGESDRSGYVSNTRRRPKSPATVTVSSGTYADFSRVSWPKMTSVPLYSVFRSPVRYGEYPYVGTTADTVFHDSTCPTNTVLYYIVISILLDSLRGEVDGVGTGGRLGPPKYAHIDTLAGATYLTWEPGPFPAQEYGIYRASDYSGPFKKIDSTETLFWYDMNPLPGNLYYKISAKNLQETPPCSLTLVANPLLPGIPDTIYATRGSEANAIRVTWSTVPKATGYNLYRAPTDSFELYGSAIASTTGTSFTDVMTSDSLYFYKVTALNDNGETHFSSVTARGYRTPHTVPAPVVGLRVEPANESILIRWTPPSTAVGFEGYHVYRAPSENGTYELFYESELTNFIDTPSLSYPTTYWYRITAYNQLGDGPGVVVEAGRE